jgi:hypothetical protein
MPLDIITCRAHHLPFWFVVRTCFLFFCVHFHLELIEALSGLRVAATFSVPSADVPHRASQTPDDERAVSSASLPLLHPADPARQRFRCRCASVGHAVRRIFGAWRVSLSAPDPTSSLSLADRSPATWHNGCGIDSCSSGGRARRPVQVSARVGKHEGAPACVFVIQGI